MKRCLALTLALACVLCLLPVNAQAALDYDEIYDFWFWNSKEYESYAQWKWVNGGVDFKLKMKNTSSCIDVDAYTFEISAMDAYEEEILLECSDGRCYNSLLYTGDKTFRKGVTDYTEYFALRSNDKIRYVTVKLVKYHTDYGTVEVDEEDQVEFTFKIK